LYLATPGIEDGRWPTGSPQLATLLLPADLVMVETAGKKLLTQSRNAIRIRKRQIGIFIRKNLMSDPALAVDEKSPAEAATDVGAPQPKTDAERIRSAVARLTSSSIDGLEALSSELQDLQKFLHSEVQRVQREIDSALAGINIIIETLEPLKGRPDYSRAGRTDTHVLRGHGRQLFRSFG
jgi:hypothetical protein